MRKIRAGINVAIGQTLIEKPVDTGVTLGSSYVLGGAIGYGTIALASVSTKAATITELGGYALGGSYSLKVGSEFFGSEKPSQKVEVVTKTATELIGFAHGATAGSKAAALSGFIPQPSGTYKLGIDKFTIRKTNGKTPEDVTLYRMLGYRQESTGKGDVIFRCSCERWKLRSAGSFRISCSRFRFLAIWFVGDINNGINLGSISFRIFPRY